VARGGTEIKSVGWHIYHQKHSEIHSTQLWNTTDRRPKIAILFIFTPAGAASVFKRKPLLLCLNCSIFLEPAEAPNSHSPLQDSITCPLLRVVCQHPSTSESPAHRAAAQARSPEGSRSPAGRVADDLARVTVPIMGRWKIPEGRPMP
jgi:hypothetical protein